MNIAIVLVALSTVGFVHPFLIPISQQNGPQELRPFPNPNEVHLDPGHQVDRRQPSLPDIVKQSLQDILSDASCDLRAIIQATGSNLVTLVKGSSSDCMNGIFSLTGQDANNACNENDMITIANEFKSLAPRYQSNNPSATQGFFTLLMYMKGCYYTAWNQKFPAYSTNQRTPVADGIRSLLNLPGVERGNTNSNPSHYLVLKETISIAENLLADLSLASRFAQFLGGPIASSYRFDNSQECDVATAINVIFFKVHNDQSKAGPYFTQNADVPAGLSSFMDRKSDLVGKSCEYVLYNAATELSRFLNKNYAGTYSKVAPLVKQQLQKYNTGLGARVYAVMAANIDYFIKEKCSEFGTCDFKSALEKKVLSVTKSCPKTYTDTFNIRAQAMSSSETDIICNRLKAQENYFHNLVKDNWTPVNPDTNDKIEVVVFNNSGEYAFFANLFFGINTNNGGMYIEGDPSRPGNIARYMCYEAYNNGQFDVWNLEHEFTHYLDGRYDMVGNFDTTRDLSVVWWGEGFAEYAAKKNDASGSVDAARRKQWPLSQLFKTQYGDETRVYRYGYLAVRFMFEKHRGDVDRIVGFFRTGKYNDYTNYINGIGTKYDQEFSTWCDCIANNKPC